MTDPAPSPTAPVYAITEKPPEFPCDLIRPDETGAWFDRDPLDIMRRCDPSCTYESLGYTHWCATNPGKAPDTAQEQCPEGRTGGLLAEMHEDAKRAFNQPTDGFQLDGVREAIERAADEVEEHFNEAWSDMRCDGEDAVKHDVGFNKRVITDILLSALRPVMAQQAKRCDECGNELSACGEPADDGIPTDDCKVCQLRSELSALRAQLAESKQAFDALDTWCKRREDEITGLRTQLADAVEGKRVAEEAVMKAFDAIFPFVPEANDDQGNPLSVEDKIDRMGDDLITLRATNAKLVEALVETAIPVEALLADINLAPRYYSNEVREHVSKAVSLIRAAAGVVNADNQTDKETK